MLICLWGCNCNSPFLSSEKSGTKHWDRAHQESFYWNRLLPGGGSHSHSSSYACQISPVHLKWKDKGLCWNLLCGSKWRFVPVSHWIFGIASCLCTFGKRRGKQTRVETQSVLLPSFLLFLFVSTEYAPREICKPSSTSEHGLHLQETEPNIQQEPTFQVGAWPQFMAAYAETSCSSCASQCRLAHCLDCSSSSGLPEGIILLPVLLWTRASTLFTESSGTFLFCSKLILNFF